MCAKKINKIPRLKFHLQFYTGLHNCFYFIHILRVNRFCYGIRAGGISFPDVNGLSSLEWSLGSNKHQFFALNLRCLLFMSTYKGTHPILSNNLSIQNCLDESFPETIKVGWLLFPCFPIAVFTMSDFHEQRK